MIRVVIDTNAVVSAMLRSGGLPEAVFNLAMERRTVQLYFPPPVLAEYEEVLSRPRLNISPDKVTIAMVRIRDAGLPATPISLVNAARDPDDNIFMECAQAVDAHYLITGNIKDFPLVWQTTRTSSFRRSCNRLGYRLKCSCWWPRV